MTNQRLVLEFSQTAHSILPSVFVRTNDTPDNPSIFLLRPSGSILSYYLMRSCINQLSAEY